MKTLLLSCALVLALPLLAHAQKPAPMPGEVLAFDRTKGNCLACHTMRGGDAPSNVGPKLNDMKNRFPKRADLVAILTDETKRNALTPMPPFGRNHILNDDEIEKIVDFLYTL
jgi:sulfur-oxidizing protein SoxX